MIKWIRNLLQTGPNIDEEVQESSSDQAVIVHILAEDVQTDDPIGDLATLEDELQELLGGGGEVDGHDIGSEDANVYVYGPSAESIFRIIRSHLISGELTGRAKVTLRFGQPGSPERIVQLPDGQ